MDLKEYKVIAKLLYASFILNAIVVIVLNLNFVESKTIEFLGVLTAEMVKQFFYGSLGATIACSIYLSRDKDDNEEESLQPNPDPTKLRLPDRVDTLMYGQRLITSGILAVIGTLIILGGFSYLEVDLDSGLTFKLKLFFATASFMIGIKQWSFLKVIDDAFEKIFRKTG